MDDSSTAFHGATTSFPAQARTGAVEQEEHRYVWERCRIVSLDEVMPCGADSVPVAPRKPKDRLASSAAVGRVDREALR
jgi:hypothetical protein